MSALFLFFIGLFVGSFLNVIIDRLPRDENFLKGRSHCEFCNHVLSWYDLIPVVSFITLNGRCRYCKKAIGYKYPIIELTTGTVFAFGIIYFNQNHQSLLSILYYLFVVSSLIIIFYIDFFNGIIPDSVILPLGAVSLLYGLFTNASYLPEKFLSGIFAFLFFLLLVIVTKGKGMGMGDVKLVFVMGIILGFPGIFTSIYIAFVSGAIVAVFLMIFGKKKFKSAIAFGPFLVFGAFTILLFGDLIWKNIILFFR